MRERRRPRTTPLVLTSLGDLSEIPSRRCLDQAPQVTSKPFERLKRLEQGELPLSRYQYW